MTGNFSLFIPIFAQFGRVYVPWSLLAKVLFNIFIQESIFLFFCHLSQQRRRENVPVIKTEAYKMRLKGNFFFSERTFS